MNKRRIFFIQRVLTNTQTDKKSVILYYLNRFFFQERILLEPMYEAPGSGVSAILIDGEVIRDGKQPVLFSGDERVDVCTMKLRN
jgi:hypothetical protein